MTLRERILLLIVCLVTVAGSAAAVLMLDGYGVVSIVMTSDGTRPSASHDENTRIALQRIEQPGTFSTPRDDLDVEALRRVDAILRSAQNGTDDDVGNVPPHIEPLLPSLTDKPAVGQPTEIVAEIETNDDAADETWTTETSRDPVPPLLRGPRLATRPTAKPQTSSSAQIAARVELNLPWRKAAKRTAAQSYSLSERLAEISPRARKRLVSRFLTAGVSFPPSEIGMVAIKDQKIVELHARQDGGEWKLVHQYKVLAASGSGGPKLRQGDKQVPEGVYGISFLNPNSKYHVALRVNYPNEFDRRMAEKDGRKDLGGDIMIHGKAASIGCLAVGDEAAEELFVLADLAGLNNIKVVIAPTDFRRYGVPDVGADKPKWVPQLYTEVASAMSEFKPPPSVGLLSFFGKW